VDENVLSVKDKSVVAFLIDITVLTKAVLKPVPIPSGLFPAASSASDRLVNNSVPYLTIVMFVCGK